MYSLPKDSDSVGLWFHLGSDFHVCTHIPCWQNACWGVSADGLQTTPAAINVREEGKTPTPEMALSIAASLLPQDKHQNY